MERRLLFASDLDGTIVDSSGHVPPEMREAICRFQKEAGYFSIATGRGLTGVRQYDLPLNCPSVFENGGLICFPNGRPLRTFPFSKSERRRLRALMEKEQQHIDYAFFSNFYNHRYVFLVPDQGRQEDVRQFYAMSFDYLTRNEDDFFVELEKGAARLAIVGNIAVSPGFNHSTNTDYAGRHYHEFNHRGATKGSGVQLVAGHLEVRLQRVIVAGNDINDVSMFRRPFGVRLAVGHNCPEAILRHATHHVASIAELPDVLHGVTRKLLA